MRAKLHKTHKDSIAILAQIPVPKQRLFFQSANMPNRNAKLCPAIVLLLVAWTLSGKISKFLGRYTAQISTVLRGSMPVFQTGSFCQDIVTPHRRENPCRRTIANKKTRQKIEDRPCFVWKEEVTVARHDVTVFCR